MKYSLLIMLALGIITGCNNAATEQKENVALIEKYIQAVEAKDYDAMATLLDDSYLGLGPSIYDSIGKDAALASWKENIENLYESIAYERSQIAPVIITNGENAGEWIANWAQLRITYKNDRGSVVIWANTNYKIANGKIIKSYTVYNEADALRQLGYVFINPKNL